MFLINLSGRGVVVAYKVDIIKALLRTFRNLETILKEIRESMK